MAEIVIGVGGGIAAYKVPGLVRHFTETGNAVTVVPTEAALQFVGESTWAALSGRPVSTQVWDRVHEVNHVALGQNADLVVVAPATADLLARAAAGRADDLLTATLLTARCPVLFAPAMHTEMWEHPATQANVATLRSRGAHVLDPAVGRLTGADTGRGRMPEPDVIHSHAEALLAPDDLAGLRIVVSAGGTREPVDPVRYLGNRSSGKQGYALALAAARRGAEVTLVAANPELPPPAGVDVVEVQTAAQMQEAVDAASANADVVVMAAAVADFRPATVESVKLKKGSDSEPTAIALERNPDILAGLVTGRSDPAQTIVGFAAETGDADGSVEEYGHAKLRSKGCDLLVVNNVADGRVFAEATNAVVILDREGGRREIPTASKLEIGEKVWDSVLAFRASTPRA